MAPRLVLRIVVVAAMLAACSAQLVFDPVGAGQDAGGDDGGAKDADGAAEETDAASFPLVPSDDNGRRCAWDAPFRASVRLTLTDDAGQPLSESGLPFLTADEQVLVFDRFFTSNGELAFARRTSKTSFGPVRRLAFSNTADDRRPTLSDDGKTLYYGSGGGSLGGGVVRADGSGVDGEFGDAAVMIRASNTVEPGRYFGDPFLTAGGTDLYYAAAYVDAGILRQPTAGGPETMVLAGDARFPVLDAEGLTLYVQRGSAGLRRLHRADTNQPFAEAPDAGTVPLPGVPGNPAAARAGFLSANGCRLYIHAVDGIHVVVR